MKSKCVVCGRDIERGIICEKCDHPRASRGSGKRATAAPASEVQENFEGFPKAVVPFPAEAVPLAMRSVWDVISAARLPALLLTASGSLRYVSDEARQLLGWSSVEELDLSELKDHLGIDLGPVDEARVTDVQLEGRDIELSFVPLAGGADGTAVLLRDFEPLAPPNTISADAVLPPLRALREALSAALRRKSDPLLEDTASMVEKIVATLETTQTAPTESEPQDVAVTAIISEITSRFAPIAQLKGLKLQGDVPEIQEVVSGSAEVTRGLEIFLRNSLSYVPRGGQIFVGARTVRQKNKQLALFFVMDNGPIVPEPLRKTIFTPAFEWSEKGRERTGRNLHEAEKIASRLGGRCWVECKSGKSCTFFMTVKLRN